jgi:tRNA pseudouridine55 synthase
VLLVGLGQATRLLRFLAELTKSYEGEVVLGAATATLDAAGEVVATAEMTGISAEDVRAAASRFVGDIEQVPPMVSAVKVGGRRLHQLARAGIEVERAPRRVTVSRFDVEPLVGEPLVYRISVDCSSGTYVRVLAADLGVALGGYAHLRGLRRTAVGPFTAAAARPLDEVGPDDVLPPVEAVSGRPRVEADDDLAAAVRHGKVLGRDRFPPGDGPWAVIDGAGVLLAVYEPYGDDRAKPAVVLVQPGLA